MRLSSNTPAGHHRAAILAALVGAAPLARADFGDQLAKLTPMDAIAGDEFGVGVAISETTALIGAAGNEGGAYIFDLSPSTGPIELFRLMPDTIQPGTEFGRSVALSGSLAVVTAIDAAQGGVASGLAYAFDATTGQQLFTLAPSDGANRDEFGSSIATNGELIVVGAIFDDDRGSGSGSVYVFDSTGAQIRKLVASDGRGGDLFGYSVAISGNLIVVGATGDDGFRGSAYIFDATTGSELAKVMAADRASADQFGAAIAAGGSTLLVGSIGDDDLGLTSGSVYAFDITDPANPIPGQKILAGDGAAGDAFGRSIAISGTMAMIGATDHDAGADNAGAAYVFDLEAGVQLAKLVGGDAGAGDRAGFSIALTDHHAILGARYHDSAGLNAGAAYLFELNPQDTGGCPADVDGNDLIDVHDLFAYLELFRNGDLSADIDGDGDLDARDLFAFLDLYASGCGGEVDVKRPAFRKLRKSTRDIRRDLSIKPRRFNREMRELRTTRRKFR